MGRKHTPFTSLSRRKRRAKTLHFKNLIYRERDRLGGIFYDECDQAVALASGRWTWSDIIFLSQDPAIFWNAEIITANVAFADAVENIAFNEAFSKLNAAETQQEMHLDFTPDVSSNGKRWLRKPALKYPQFDGLTFNDLSINARWKSHGIIRQPFTAVTASYLDTLPGSVCRLSLRLTD